MKSIFRCTIILLGVALIIGITPFASSGETFPSKNIVIIMPHGPGGGGDVATRILSAGMEKYLKVPVIIKNVPGGGSTRGMTNLWRSKPDGHTIAMNYVQHNCNANIFSKVEFDTRKFELVGQFVRVDYVLGVPKNGQFQTVDAIKNSKSPVRYCGSGWTSNGSIAMLSLAEEAGFPVAPVVGFSGASSSLIGMLSGECDVMPSGAAIKNFIDRGDMVPIMVFSEERYEFYPEVPTLKEFGFPENLATIGSLNYVLWAPPKTPKDRLKILEEAMLKSTHDNEAKLKAMTCLPAARTGEQTRKIVSDTYNAFDKYKGVLEKYKKD